MLLSPKYNDEESAPYSQGHQIFEFHQEKGSNHNSKPTVE